MTAAQSPAPERIEPIPFPLRRELELTFAEDFGEVSLHLGQAPARLGMAAFACGSQIHLDPARFRPGESSFEELLAHELTHVVQQRRGRVNAPEATVLVDPALEREAEQAGHLFAHDPTGRQHGRLAALLRPGTALAGVVPVIQPLVMHGPLPAGGFGALSAAQMRDWINAKITRVNVPLANVGNCANYIQGYPAGGMGGGTNLHLQGQVVKHISHGIMGGNSGCTVFFIEAPGGQGHVKILGVGWHHNGSATRYKLDWGANTGPWHANAVICTVHGPGCAANH
jgi:hypothetical protein